MQVIKTGAGVFHSIYYDKNKDWRIKDNVTLIYNYLNKNHKSLILKNKNSNDCVSILRGRSTIESVIRNLSKREGLSLLDASKRLKQQVYKNDFSEFCKINAVKPKKKCFKN